MSSTSQPPLPSPACPLARDLDGNPVALPDNTAAWRVRRHTGGRPRIQLGADKQPMHLPLGYTLADVEDILPPGNYRLDAVNAKGDVLDLTVRLKLGQLRNANVDDADEGDEGEDDAPVAISTRLPHSLSDVRLVLEANVRSTQLAFQHNEKTLELGLRMAETLRDGVHVLVDAQADWIKSIASSRGFFRNAPANSLLSTPLEPAKGGQQDDDEDDEEADEPAGQQDWVQQVAPMVAIVAQQVVTTLIERFSKPATAAATQARDDSTAPSKFDLAALFDWRRASPKARVEATATALPAPAASATPLALLSSMPPALLQKVMQVRGMLSPDEQQRVMALLSAFDPADLPALATHAESMSAEQLAEFLRAQIAKSAA